jgi:hypothetical protein
LLLALGRETAQRKKEAGDDDKVQAINSFKN